MIEERIAHFTLKRVYATGEEEPVGKYGTAEEGIAAGRRALATGHAYTLYAGKKTVCKFAHSRLAAKPEGAEAALFEALAT